VCKNVRIRIIAHVLKLLSKLADLVAAWPARLSSFMADVESETVPPSVAEIAAGATGIGIECVLKSNAFLAEMISTVAEQNTRLHRDLEDVKKVR
jgi:hypothetical protein